MDIEPFGDIDHRYLESYYSADILVQGQAVAIDVNFESNEMELTQLETLASYIVNVDETSRLAFEAIADDYDLDEISDTARFYLQHHLEEFSEQEIDSLFGTPEVDKDAFLSALKLVRIGFYPEDEDAYAIFDIQFPLEYTRYLMAVSFDQAGNISGISMES